MKYSPLLYKDRDAWMMSNNKKIAFIGMSGTGKTFVAEMLSSKHDWLHYSVDYMIGSLHLKDAILKNNGPLKLEKNQFSIQNLTALSHYLGKPGNPDRGGLAFKEYLNRQRKHAKAETLSMLDISNLIKNKSVEGNINIVCDTSGSLCEIVNPNDPKDKILSNIAKQTLIILIKEDEKQIVNLKDRFRKAPKPMYYQEKFLQKIWYEFCKKNNVNEKNANPDDFSLYGFEKLLAHRRPIYQAIATGWGIEISANEISDVKSDAELNQLVGDYLSLAGA